MFTPLFESNVLTVSQVIVNDPHLCRAHGFQEDVRCEHAEPDEKASGYLVIKWIENRQSSVFSIQLSISHVEFDKCMQTTFKWIQNNAKYSSFEVSRARS